MKKQLLLILVLLIGFVISFLFLISNNETSDPEVELKNTRNWSDKIVGYDEKKYKNPLKIAILDSGINKEHTEFRKIKFEEYNAITGKREKIKDEYGHGTAIAGIIAARGDKIQGVIANPIIYDVKVLNEKGEGTIESVINGINWSIKNDVDIINISFGFSSDREDLKKAINSAYDNGIIIIAAAGNTMGLSVDYPANYENVISISSLNNQLNIDPYSATGKIDYSTPGVDIISTDKDGGYSSFTGTSFACAYATGIIASILKQEKIKSKNELENIIDKYIVPIGQLELYGKGLLTLNKASVEENK